MARPPSDLKTYSVELTPADAELAERLGEALGITAESRKGRPSRSAVIRHLIREAGKALERKREKTEKFAR